MFGRQPWASASSGTRCVCVGSPGAHGVRYSHRMRQKIGRPFVQRGCIVQARPFRLTHSRVIRANSKGYLRARIIKQLTAADESTQSHRWYLSYIYHETFPINFCFISISTVLLWNYSQPEKSSFLVFLIWHFEWSSIRVHIIYWCYLLHSNHPFSQ